MPGLGFGICRLKFAFGFEIKIGTGKLLIFVFQNFDVRRMQIFRNFAAFTDKIRKEKIYAILRRRKRGSSALPHYEKAPKNVSSVPDILGKNGTILGGKGVCF